VCPAAQGDQVDLQLTHQMGEHRCVATLTGATSSTNGLPLPSTRAWILVLNAPRELPIA